MLRFLIRLFLLYLLFLVVLPFLPLPLDFEPKAHTVKLPEFTGPLAANKRLDNVEYLFKDELVGPESLAYYQGSIYTGTVGGNIYKITGKSITPIAKFGKQCEGRWEEEVCGRPLGLRFDKQGKLYAMDAYYGLHVVDIKTGFITPLVPAGTDIQGKKLLFGNDLTINDDGVIYFTEASNKWPLNKILYTVLEYESTGRVLSYDPKTKKISVLLENIHLPNGIQLSHDQKSLLISELAAQRILRYHLQGPKKGQVEVFADQLPGEPDNIRLSSKGGYWIGFSFGRSASKPTLGDRIAPFPYVNKAVMRFLYIIGTGLKYATKYYPSPALKDFAAVIDNAWILYETVPKYGFVLELDANGKVAQSLHSQEQKIHLISEVLEHDGYLYLGSYKNPFLGRVKL